MLDAAGVVNALVRIDGVYGEVRMFTFNHETSEI